jgi:hypothetical protein
MNMYHLFGRNIQSNHALDWIGLDWIGLDWIGLDWIGLDWIGIGLDDCTSWHLHAHLYLKFIGSLFVRLEAFVQVINVR